MFAPHAHRSRALRSLPPLVSALWISLIATGPARAGDVLEVPGEYPTIQAALDASTDGDEVVVASGTYMLTDGIVLPDHAITLRSATLDPASTVLDGSALTAETASAVVRADGDTPGTRTLTGFTLLEGPGGMRTSTAAETGTVRIEGNRFEGNEPLGGLFVSGLNVEVVDNVFTGNRAKIWGGAIFLGGNAVVTGNTFTGNEAIPFGGVVLTQGGAIYLAGLNGRSGLVATISDNHFEDNSCTDYGGAINCGGWSGTISIAGNTFLENHGGVCAGAIYQYAGDAVMSIDDNLFVGNYSPQGGAIALEVVTGSLIRSNTFVGHFGNETLKLKDTSNVTVDRNIFAFNPARAMMFMTTTNLTLTCNDSFDNPAGNYPVGLPTEGDGNISLDPEFCNLAAGDYSLAQGSPCLPAGNTCGVLIGAYAMGCGVSPTEPVSWGALKDRFSSP